MASASIALNGIGKRYGQQWVFRSIDHIFKLNVHTVILGPNGSGKSTLLQIILGSTVPSEGTVSVTHNGTEVGEQDNLGLFSIAAPYLELIEEFTLREVLDFHRKMIPFKDGLTIDSVLELLYLKEAENKAVKYFSSGMKQRAKLGLALLSDTPFVLLDEPASNLDSQAIDWYKKLVESHRQDRIIIVCSNDQKDEFSFCEKQLNMSDHK